MTAKIEENDARISQVDQFAVVTARPKLGGVEEEEGEDCITIFKQLLDEVFVISGIIKVEVRVISRSRRLRLIPLTETLIIPDITKTESNNCFIIHCF